MASAPIKPIEINLSVGVGVADFVALRADGQLAIPGPVAPFKANCLVIRAVKAIGVKEKHCEAVAK